MNNLKDMKKNKRKKYQMNRKFEYKKKCLEEGKGFFCKYLHSTYGFRRIWIEEHSNAKVQ
jgi:hypothetical protein